MKRKTLRGRTGRKRPRGWPAKKSIAVWLLLAPLLIVCLAGCKRTDDGALTVEAVRNLAVEKGAELTWSDFERYPSVETGSGLYILVYEINTDYRLMIGGMPDETPTYLYLVSTKDGERYIDVRYNDIDDFLNRTE